MRDIDLYQILLGLTAPWQVTAVEVIKPVPPSHLGEITVGVEYPSGQLLHCPKCEAVVPRHDSRPRRWRHLNTMQWKTFVVADVPRTHCPEHGVLQVGVPWAEDQSRFTAMFEAFTVDVMMAVRSKVQAEILTALSWDQVDRIMDRAVARGLDRRQIESLRYLGTDEKSFGKGHDCVSVLCDLDGKRVLDVILERKKAASIELFEAIPAAQREKIQAIAMDMWEPFMGAARAVLPQAEIVHDKFHIVRELTKAVDLVRRQEHRELKGGGDFDTLKHTKYIFLKNPKNWTDGQQERFQSLKIDALRVGKAWSIKEAFAEFWEYRYAGSARKFFDRW